MPPRRATRGRPVVQEEAPTPEPTPPVIPTPPESVDSVMLQTLQRMSDAMQRISGNSHRPDQPTEREADKALERFLKFHPPTFHGKPNQEEEAQTWIEQMEKIFSSLTYTEERKVYLATFRLEGIAHNWWNREKGQREWNWNDFKERFKKEFIPRWVVERKEDEFQSLRQGNRTVEQYAAEFTRLSKYCPKLVQDEVDRTRLFTKGLRPELKRVLISTTTATYADAVELAARVEGEDIDQAKQRNKSGFRPDNRKRVGSSNWQRRGKFQRGGNGNPGRFIIRCFNCGEEGHKNFECPRPRRNPNWNRTRGGYRGTRPGPGRPSQGTSAITAAGPSRPVVNARVVALDRTDATTTAVVEGTIFFCDKAIKILIDPGSTHSFISKTFVTTLGCPGEETSYDMVVSTPLGKQMSSNQIHRDCGLLVGKTILKGDLISLPIEDYDAILGMD